MKKIRITSPVPSDGGTFTCVDLSRANEMHSIDLVFDGKNSWKSCHIFLKIHVRRVRLVVPKLQRSESGRASVQIYM